MHNLIARIGDGRLLHQVFHYLAVLHLGQAQHRVPDAVLFPHVGNHAGQVVQLFLILVPGPFVGSVGQVFIVVLARIVGGIEQILDIVEPDDVLAALLFGTGLPGQEHQHGHKGP